jgi:hypothetical protein
MIWRIVAQAAGGLVARYEESDDAPVNRVYSPECVEVPCTSPVWGSRKSA